MVSPDANAIRKKSARIEWYSPARILAGLSIAALALIGIAIPANKSVRGLVGNPQHMVAALIFALILLVIVFAGVTLAIARGKHHGSKAALREEQERYRDLFENAHDLIQLVEPDGLLLDVNRTWRDTLGYTQVDVNAGLYTWDVLEPSSIPHCRQLVERMNAGENVGTFEFQFRTKDGRTIDVEGASHTRFANSQAVGRCGVFRNVTERKRAAEELLVAQKQLRELLEHEQLVSRIDALTQIPNRRGFYEMAETERRRASRNRQPVTLAYLDVDDFKKVNDTLGHKAGDQLLECVARTLRTKLRVSDIVARLGGDEFAIFLPETGSQEAEVVLRKVQNVLQEAMRLHQWTVGFSIGAVAFVGVPTSLDSMVSFADAAMYSVKRSGKNNFSSTLMGVAAGTLRKALGTKPGDSEQGEEAAGLVVETREI